MRTGHDHFADRLIHHFAGRHRHGGRGLGRFGGGFMDDGDMGGRGMRMGRKLSSEDLQLLILALLAEKPRHGYEIIKALEEKSKGFYAPSPGMVYPALTYLEEIGHATVVADGARKHYHLTATGQTHLAEHQDAVEMTFQQLERIGEKMERMRQVFAGEAASDAGGAEFGPRGSKLMHEARSLLKTALSEAQHAPAAEQQRIAEILKRAAAEIRNKS